MKANKKEMTQAGSILMQVQSDFMKHEFVKKRLLDLINTELKYLNVEIHDEHIWELGHKVDGPNPHTDNIKNLIAYRDTLCKIADDYGLEYENKK